MFADGKSLMVNPVHSLSGGLSRESSISIVLIVALATTLEVSGSRPTSSWLELSSTAVVGRAETKNWLNLGRSRFLNCSSANCFFFFFENRFQTCVSFYFYRFLKCQGFVV